MMTTTLIDKYKVTLHDGRMAVITPEYIEDGPETAFEKGYAFYASAVKNGRNIVFSIQANDLTLIPESAFNLSWNVRGDYRLMVGMFTTAKSKLVIAGTLNGAEISQAEMLTILLDYLDGLHVEPMRLLGKMDWKVKSGNGYTYIFTDNKVYSYVLSGDPQILREGDPIAHGEVLTHEAFKRMAEGAEHVKPFAKLPIAPQYYERIGAALYEAEAVKAAAA